eukprot:6212500-Pleurochrysis_carterae.AAC.3
MEAGQNCTRPGQYSSAGSEEEGGEAIAGRTCAERRRRRLIAGQAQGSILCPGPVQRQLDIAVTACKIGATHASHEQGSEAQDSLTGGDMGVVAALTGLLALPEGS